MDDLLILPSNGNNLKQGAGVYLDEPLIQQATEEDLKHCASVYKEAFAQAPYYEEWRFQDALEMLGAIYLKDPETCFCMVYQGQIIGFAFCSLLGRFRAVIEEIAVRPSFEGRGWGRRLMEHCLSVMQARGVPAVVLLAHRQSRAYGFYQRIGFHEAKNNILMIYDL